MRCRILAGFAKIRLFALYQIIPKIENYQKSIVWASFGLSGLSHNPVIHLLFSRLDGFRPCPSPTIPRYSQWYSLGRFWYSLGWFYYTADSVDSGQSLSASGNRRDSFFNRSTATRKTRTSTSLSSSAWAGMFGVTRKVQGQRIFKKLL